jgi:hypothetical protein
MVLASADIPSAIRKLTRRVEDLEELASVDANADFSGIVQTICAKVNQTLEDVFGRGTSEVDRYFIATSSFFAGTGKLDAFHRARTRAIGLIKGAVQGLQETLDDAEQDAAGKILRAYQGLDLHSEIARAASKLYEQGHHATAVEHAVRALNDLVRLRSNSMACH